MAPFRPQLQTLDDRTTPAVIGGPDPTFATTGAEAIDLGGTDEKFNAVVVQSDGKILAAGTNGLNFVVARFLSNGLLDSTYGLNGLVTIDFGGNDAANGITLDSSGRAVVVGTTSNGAGGGDIAVARINATDGTLDTSFGVSGKQTIDINKGNDAGYALTIDASSRVVIAGASSGQMAATRLTPSGAIDTTFGTGGIKTVSLGATEEARAVFLTPTDQKIILAGSTTRTGQADGIAQDFVAVRLTADGAAIDTGFGSTNVTIAGNTFRILDIDFGGTDVLFGGIQDPNGRYLVTGTTSAGNNFTAARFDANGNLDSSFGSAGRVTVDLGGNDIARSVDVQQDGRIVLGGTSNTTMAAARLTTAGVPDASFGMLGKGYLSSLGDARGFGAALGIDDGVVLVGSSGSNAGIGRLRGVVGSPTLLLASGTPDGAVKQYTTTDGKYVDGPAFAPFPGVANGPRVAVGDVTGDGVADRVAVTGPGVAPLVVLYDGKTGTILANQLGFEIGFTGGMFVAVGDVNNDGHADIAVSPDQGGGPRVRIFDGAAFSINNAVTLADFLAIDDSNFRGGVRPALGDINSDGRADLVVSAGFTGGPRIAVWNANSLAPNVTPTRLVPDFFAFESTLRDGAFVAVGDINGDGNADLVLAGGPNGGPRVRIVSGAGLLGAPAFESLDQIPSIQLANFFAGDQNSRGGVRVTVRDVDGDNLADLVTGSGDKQASQILVYKGTTLRTNMTSPTPDQVIDPFAAVVTGGVYVG